MRQFILIISFIFLSSSIWAQDKDIQEIISVLKRQEAAWNEGDLEKFMKGYWESDSLTFIGGSSGLKYGWQTTLDNYKKNYPDRATMGVLTFKFIQIKKLSSKSAMVIGQWKLKREKDEPQGYFSLIWKKIKGEWLIIADHSS